MTRTPGLPTPAQHEALKLLRESGGWIGNLSTPTARWRIICPAGSDDLFGPDIATKVFDGLRAKGLVEDRELATDQQSEFSRRAPHLTPPAKGWFLPLPPEPPPERNWTELMRLH